MSVEQRRGSSRAPEQPKRVEAPRGRIYVALDTESTGVEADSGEVIEIAAVKFRLENNGTARVLDSWQTYVKPKNPIPYKITHLTGIRQSDVQHAPGFVQIEEKLRSFLGNFPIVGHSIESDIGFLARHSFEVKNAPIDTYELATLLLPQMGNYSLVAVAGALKVNLGEAHRAMADTLMAMHVFAGLVAKIEELPPDVLGEVNRIAKDLPNWSLRPIFSDVADNRQQTQLEQNNGAFGNLAAKLKQQLAEKSGEELDFMLLLPQEQPAPLLPASPMPAIPYDKHGQRVDTMAHAIKTAFDEQQHILIEMPGNERDRAAGFLLPAVATALEKGKNVVIAVNSETQRDRVMNRLVPLLQNAISLSEESNSRRDRKRRGEEKKPFTAVSVKPQQNYLCVRRWESFRKTGALTPDEKKMLIRVLLWLPNTSEGDSAELRIPSQERFWAKVNSQKGLCVCEAGQPCFFARARERAKGAHVIVVDQSVVLADLLGQAGTLPEYDYLIIDEAHHFEEEAGRQFGNVVTPNSLFDFLDWISRPITWLPQGGHNGFIHTLPRYYGSNTSQPARDLLDTFHKEVTAQVELTRSSTGVFLQELTNTLAQRNQETGQGDGRIRLDNKFRVGGAWNELAGPWELFKQDWEEIYYLLHDLRAEADALRSELSQYETLKRELDYYVKHCEKMLDALTDAFEGGNQADVFWLATHPRTQLVSVFSQPLQVGPLLAKHLFSKKKSVALVSPTLTTAGDFSFIKERLGLSADESRELRLLPERDYSRTLLYLPMDIAEPSQPNYQKSVDQHVMELAKNAKGRILVLFSSNSALRLTYKAVQRPLEAENILVLGQGLDGTRRSVMERFKNTKQALLLSTLSYWESNDFGQDDDLENTAIFNTLVISKLPFDPPSDPLFAARTESRIFDDPFVQYSLPRTILRFRQAFERLLGGLESPGAVVMLDSRLTKKSYGPLFLNSLPPMPSRRASLQELVPQVSDWLHPSEV